MTPDQPADGPKSAAPMNLADALELISTLTDALRQRQQEPWCQACNGSGEMPGTIQAASGDPQDAYDGIVPCSECKGTGERQQEQGAGDYARKVLQLARSSYKPCKSCGSPYGSGMACSFCGDRSPHVAAAPQPPAVKG